MFQIYVTISENPFKGQRKFRSALFHTCCLTTSQIKCVFSCSKQVLFLLFSVRASSYQCNQIPGVLAAEVSTAAEDDQRHKEDCIGHIVCPWITSHKILGIINKGEDGDKGESDQQLHCENHEDLAGQKKTILVQFAFRCHFIVM